MIIQNIDTIGTFVVEFLRKSKRCWRVRKQTKLSVTSVDSMFIEELKEDKAME